MFKYTCSTSFGNILIQANNSELISVMFDGSDALFSNNNAVIEKTISQLDEYFSGKRTRFDLPIKLKGTPFQLAVWEAVVNINYGETASYKSIALSLDNLGAIRAVGKANGNNKFHLIIPCHRIIGVDGSLTGYAGGLEVKKQLLIHEGAIEDSQLELF